MPDARADRSLHVVCFVIFRAARMSHAKRYYIMLVRFGFDRGGGEKK